MNNLHIFESLPKGFRYVESAEDRERLARSISRAFGDCYYPIPTYPISHEDYLKLYYELGLQWIDNAQKYGVVVANEDFSGTLILTKMKDCLDSGKLIKEDKTYDFLSPQAKENVSYIFAYTYDDEKYLEYNEDDIYIEIFAVDTERQGEKIGSHLMKGLFDECDKAKKDILLLTSIATNVEMYKHFGFEVMREHHVEEINSDAYYLKRRYKV